MQHDRNDPIVTSVINWWVWLHGTHGDRGARARLKRCDGVFKAILEPETHILINRVNEKATVGDVLKERLAVLAMVLARVKPSERTSHLPTFATALGSTQAGAPPKSEDQPRLSPMRFRVLLTTGEDMDRDIDRFARTLRRVLTILGDVPFNVPRFIDDVLYFGDQTRRAWIFEYYHTRRVDTAENTQSREETKL